MTRFPSPIRALAAACVGLAAAAGCHDPVSSDAAAGARAVLPPSVTDGPTLRQLVERRHAGLGADSIEAVRRVDSLSYLGGTALGCRVAGSLAGRTLQLYFGDKLSIAPRQPSLAEDVQAIVSRATALPATADASECPRSAATLPAAALAPGGGAAYLTAAQGGAVVTTDSTAGVFVPGGALPFDALVYITPRGPQGRLPTTLPQEPGVDIASVPALATVPGGRLNAPARVLLQRFADTGVPTAHSVVGHVTGGTLVLLPPVAGDDCSNADYEALTRTVGLRLNALGASRAPADGYAAFTGGGSRPKLCSSGSTFDWSPFGRVQIYESTATPRAVVTVAHVCGARFVARNAGGRDWAIWARLVTRTGTALPNAQGVFTRLPAGSAAAPSATTFTADAPNGLGDARALQVYYGPTLLRAVALTGPASCSA